jgi:hypothetical protein
MKVNTIAPEVTVGSALQTLIRDSKKISDGSGNGPKSIIEYVSNSYLSVLERTLNGSPQFFGNESFLLFGHEFHKRELKPKEKRRRLTKEEEAQIRGMLASLAAYAPWTKFKKGAVLEKIHVAPVYGQAFKVILDSEKARRSIDLKTTSCKTEAAFIKAAFKYNYPSQAWCYSEARKLKQFNIIGICKHKPHPIFEFIANDYPHEMQEGEDRIKSLISVYRALRKLYGYPFTFNLPYHGLSL